MGLCQGVPLLEFTYFDFAGRGELIRLMLNAADVDFDEMTVSFSEFRRVKEDEYSLWGELFSQLPVLQHGEMKLAQTLAIAQYVSEKFICYGKLTPAHRATDYMYYQAQHDLYTSMFTIGFTKDDSLAKKQLVASFVLDATQSLTTLERLAPSSGFINGRHHPTLADFVVLDMATTNFPQVKNFGVDLATYPELWSLAMRMKTYSTFLEAYMQSRGF
eukprot:GEMP01049878.1.p1 GENE.GEMP01049878.1~~GEMP01049878.1.p1  ORF type:complete len:217 (+),score=45.83 GEMP01049878.1:179-829(+)